MVLKKTGPTRARAKISGDPIRFSQFAKGNPRKGAMRGPGDLRATPRSTPPVMAASLPIPSLQNSPFGGSAPSEEDSGVDPDVMLRGIAGAADAARDRLIDWPKKLLFPTKFDQAAEDFANLSNPINTGIASAVDRIHADALNAFAEGGLIDKDLAPGKRDPLPVDIDTLQRQVQDALNDGSWTPEDRAQIVQNYRDFLRRWTQGDDSVREINNYAVTSEYHWWLAMARAEEDKNKAMADPASGDFFHTFDGPLLRTSADQYGGNIGFLLSEDKNGFLYIESLDDAVLSASAELRDNPAAAAEMITKLAAWGAYPGAQEQYVNQNVVFDGDGNPIAGRWTKDDQAALRTFLIDAIMQQAGGDEDSWYGILTDHAAQNAEVLKNGGGGSGGGGGYYRGGYGGGGGGGATGVSYTDPDQLKQLINAVARARLGYALPDTVISEFVSYYHQQEAAFVAARVAGQSAAQLDPESQAAAWIESRFRDQMAGQSANTYITELAGFLLGGGTFGSGT